MFVKIVRVFLLVVALFGWFFAFEILWFKPSFLPTHTFTEKTYVRSEPQITYYLRPHAFSPDGKILAIGRADGAVSLWSLESQKQLMSLPGNNEAVVQTWFSPDGRFLAASHNYGGFFLWELETRKKTALQMINAVQWFAFTPGSKLLIYQDWDRSEIHVWHLARSKEPIVMENAQLMDSLALFPNGRTLASVSQKVDNNRIVREVILWNVASGNKEGSFSFHPLKAYSLAAIAPDNNTVIFESENGTELSIWDRRKGKVKIGPTFSNVVNSARFSPDGKTLITLGSEMKTWDANNWQEISSVPIEYGHCQTLTTDGNTLAVADSVPRSEGFVGWLFTLFSMEPNSQELVKVWNRTGKMIAVLPDASLPLFSPDGKTLASINRDGFVQLWDIPPRKNYLRAVGLWTLGLMPVAAGLCWYWFRAKRRSRATSAP
jgi:WD40 repeat protein